jgi:cation diffusion facilitator CzcD-associated flavoprotein CzcO
MSDALGLADLEAALARDFSRLNHPPKPWVPERDGPDGQPMADVAIIGGGMCGLAAAFALRRLGIRRIRHLDRSEAGFEGPWLTYARMRSLRSPKHLTGAVLGLANLTFRAWWEAQNGAGAWKELDRIPREIWMGYLRWYRLVTGARIENKVEVVRIEPGVEAAMLDLCHSGGTAERLHARQVVLATGREGQARPRVPKPLQPFFGGLVRHSSDDIDFRGLAGRRVAVIGLAASAFDNAATALEAGAGEVILIGRAAALPRLNKMKQTVYAGFTQGFPSLPDAEKPGIVEADLVILGTGFALDLDQPAETARFCNQILRWCDRVSEPGNDEWLAAPYLGPGFEYLELKPGALPGLERIRCFTHAAQLSLGNLANDIPMVGEGAQRLAEAIAATLFVEDHEDHWQRLCVYDEPELLGDEWPGVARWDPPLGG